MSPDELQRLSVANLLRLDAALHVELARRGVSRTASSLGGELSEHLALRVYGGELSPPGTAAFDLIDAQGLRVQVKSRTLPRDVQRHFAFDSLDFDLAVCLRFDRETNALDWAREFPPSEIAELATAHRDGLRLPTGRASRNGDDVTAAFRSAIDEIEPRGARPQVSEDMTEDFDWMRALSPADQQECARDLAKAAGTERLDGVVRSWRETAIAVAAGLGSARPDWLDEPVTVERP